MQRPFRIEGYAIVSADGMIAEASGLMPNSLKLAADQRLYKAALDRADLLVHTHMTYEAQENSARRRRLILTRQVPGLAPAPDIPNAMFWNPKGASFDEACAALGVHEGRVAALGGPQVYAVFFPIGYDDFYLTRAIDVRLPGGVPVFLEGLKGKTPEDVLSEAGLKPSPTEWLDDQVSLVEWTPSGRADPDSPDLLSRVRGA